MILLNLIAVCENIDPETPKTAVHFHQNCENCKLNWYVRFYREHFLLCVCFCIFGKIFMEKALIITNQNKKPKSFIQKRIGKFCLILYEINNAAVLNSKQNFFL